MTSLVYNHNCYVKHRLKLTYHPKCPKMDLKLQVTTNGHITLSVDKWTSPQLPVQ